MLQVLRGKYPGGSAWLESRLDDLDECRAFADVAVSGWCRARCSDHHAQGTRHMKLSTFLVEDAFRGRSIGRRLLKYAMCRWLRSEVDEAIVTVTCATGIRPISSAKCVSLASRRVRALRRKPLGRCHALDARCNLPALLLSIRPTSRPAIYARLKRAEFRRIRPRCACPIRALIYETRPVGLVTGFRYDHRDRRCASLAARRHRRSAGRNAAGLSSISEWRLAALRADSQARSCVSPRPFRSCGYWERHARPPQSYRSVSVDGFCEILESQARRFLQVEQSVTSSVIGGSETMLFQSASISRSPRPQPVLVAADRSTLQRHSPRTLPM